MFDESKAVMQDILKAFGIDDAAIISSEGDRVYFEPSLSEPAIVIGEAADSKKVPVAEWLIAAGYMLMKRQDNPFATFAFDLDRGLRQQAKVQLEDFHYIADLTALHQCYLRNPVEAYCSYDEAAARNDEASLHPLAVALSLSHPMGLEVMGFDKHTHRELFEEMEFFAPVITQKRPDLSLLIALQNAWQKQRGSAFKIVKEGKRLRLQKL